MATIRDVRRLIESISYKDVHIRYVDMKTIFPKELVYGCRLKDTNEILIEQNIRGKHTEMRVIYHEIAHYIHQRFFEYHQFTLPTENKSEYAKKDYKEDFAEAVADFMIKNPETKERNKAICKILKLILEE